MSNGNLVSLNVNPCKMCMPMGSATAVYGIEGAITLLHGSQGCSTYIRRHMATHYNEPVDIASSSLTEEGTVLGGESNLLKGLENIIKVYDPRMIAVATTCLAETIGEDVPRIIRNFKENHGESDVEIVPISAGGYSGTQYEGYFMALRSILENVRLDDSKHEAVNVIPGPLSPADVRWLKDTLEEVGLEYIMFPDISENLDGGHQKEYERLPQYGTPLESIRRMAGSRITIEITRFVEDRHSPALLLKEKYGIPVMRLNPPVGLRDTDDLFKALESLGGTITDRIRRERSRYLDSMVDAHKHNAMGRAAVFGEPDFVYSVARSLLENGIKPLLTATGSKSRSFLMDMRNELEDFGMDPAGTVDDADFEEIESIALSQGVNVMIGSSDGRRISEKHGIPLVRCAFPVHDHVGGQRIRTLGYEGGLSLLDGVTNALMSGVETSFREEMFQRYYRDVTVPGIPDDGDVCPPPEVQHHNVAAVTETTTDSDEETEERPDQRSLRVAVSSKSGVLVDRHFGQTDDLYIYEFSHGSGVRYLEHRNVSTRRPDTDCGRAAGDRMASEGRIAAIIDAVKDCDIVVSMRIGESPTAKLESMGILPFSSRDMMESAVQEAVREHEENTQGGKT